MENPVIIFGAKGLGKVALDIFKSNEVMVYCLLDDDKKLHGTPISEVQVASSTDDEQYLKILGSKCEAFVATDDNRERKALFKMLNQEYKVMPVNAIHAEAMIENTASLGHGNLLAAGVMVGSYAKVGNGCLINARAVIDYEAQIADYVQIGAGSIINAGAIVEEGAFIGSGVTVVSGVRIGKFARVGAGAVVIASVPDNATVFGVPAKEV